VHQLCVRAGAEVFGNVSELVLTATWLDIIGRRAMPVGAQWSNGMSRREVQADANLVSAVGLIIGGTLGIGLPVTLVIIWICS
jgi:hypothetical protein